MREDLVDRFLNLVMFFVLGSIGICTAGVTVVGTVWIIAQIIGALT